MEWIQAKRSNWTTVRILIRRSLWRCRDLLRHSIGSGSRVWWFVGLTVGLQVSSKMTRCRKVLIALDQVLAVLIFDGATSDETISAYCWRRKHKRWIRFIDWLFYTGHCRDAYMAEKNGSQLADEYRN